MWNHVMKQLAETLGKEFTFWRGAQCPSLRQGCDRAVVATAPLVFVCFRACHRTCDV